jgi:aminomethyltransferase
MYAGVLEEHRAVRSHAGLFDVSHMGRFALEGEGATGFLERVATNRMSGVAVGRAAYTPLCGDRGGTVDDVVAYREGADAWLLVVNAANREKDFLHLTTRLPGNVKLTDISESVAQLALQGPLALSIADGYFNADITSIRDYHFLYAAFQGERLLVSRTGYTGERGVEIYMPARLAPVVWHDLLAIYAVKGLAPCGLGSRDLLRFEACMPLYGRELSEEITPLEAGLNRFVDFDKPDFIGKAALVAQRSAPHRQRIGLRLAGRNIAREGCAIYCCGEPAGYVTSGSFSPVARAGLAMALADAPFIECGEFEVDIRGKRVAARKEAMPFYRRAR